MKFKQKLIGFFHNYHFLQKIHSWTHRICKFTQLTYIMFRNAEY